jgi:hypothetical protein
MIAYRSHKMVVTSWDTDAPDMAKRMGSQISVLNSVWPLRLKNEWMPKAKTLARARARESILLARDVSSACIKLWRIRKTRGRCSVGKKAMPPAV